MLYIIKNLVLVFGLVLFGMYFYKKNIQEVTKNLLDKPLIVIILVCLSLVFSTVNIYKENNFKDIDEKRKSVIEKHSQLKEELEEKEQEYNQLQKENNQLKDKLNDATSTVKEVEKEVTVEVEKEEVEEVKEDLEYSKEEIRGMMNEVNLISTRVHSAKRSNSYVDMTDEMNQLDAIYQKAEVENNKHLFKNVDVACAYSAIMSKIEILKQIIPCYDQSEYDALSLQEAQHGAYFNEAMNNLE